MKKLRNWLLPLCTCLAVLAAALLPPRLSQLRDQQELHTVHTEALTADNNLPTQALTPEERITLVSWWSDAPDTLAFVSQELYQPEDLNQLEEDLSTELQNLAESGILPSALASEAPPVLYGTRLFLRETGNLAGARFLNVSTYVEEENFTTWMMLDEESGKVLWLELDYPELVKNVLSSAEDIGTAFLDRLGVAYLLVYSHPYGAVFQLAGCDVLYVVSIYRDHLSICPQSNWGTISDSKPTAVFVE